LFVAGGSVKSHSPTEKEVPPLTPFFKFAHGSSLKKPLQYSCAFVENLAPEVQFPTAYTG